MNRESLFIHKQTHTRENSWWLKDAKGIEVSRVCGACVEDVKRQYRPEIFDGQYEDVVEERIEEDP